MKSSLRESGCVGNIPRFAGILHLSKENKQENK